MIVSVSLSVYSISNTHTHLSFPVIGYRICVGNLIINCMHASDSIKALFYCKINESLSVFFCLFNLFVCAGVVAVTQTRKWSVAFCFTPLSFLFYLAFINLFFFSLCTHKTQLYLTRFLHFPMKLTWIWKWLSPVNFYIWSFSKAQF